MRKRSYILFVARGEDGQLRKVPIPLHYLYVLLVGGAITALSLTGIASSYLRMLVKVSHFNQLRTEKDQIKNQYSQLEQVARERDIQVASLGSLAGEVSSLYGLKSNSILTAETSDNLRDAQIHSSIDQFYALKYTALSGAATNGISLGLTRDVTTADWVSANSAPDLWPVEGQITGSFGERIDPFNGEGAFHSGVDIASAYGHPVLAPADGVVEFADFLGGYGRAWRHHPLWPPGELCRGSRAARAPRRYHRIRRPQRPFDRSAPPLRSPHQRHSGQPSQVPSPDGRPYRRFLGGKLAGTSARLKT